MRALVGLVTIVLMVGLTPATALAQTTPLALAQQFAAAQNRGDLTGTVALFTDDAVLDGNGLCTPNPCRGKAAIQDEIARRVASATLVDFKSYQVAGTMVAARNEVTNDMIRAMDLTRVINYQVFEVRGGRITALHVRWDLADPQTAAYAPAVAAAQVWGPFRPLVGFPATGAGVPAGGVLLLAAAALALLGGSVLVLRTASAARAR